MHRGSFRTLALRSLIVSVIATALLGIIAVLANRFDDLTVRVLITLAIISASSLMSLTCATLLERRPSHPLAVAGIALALAAGVLFIVGIWLDVRAGAYWRTSAVAGVLAIASAHVSLLWLARLGPRFEWVSWTAFGVIAALAGIVVWMVIGSPPEELFLRPLTVLAIVASALTIVTPVLHKLNGGANATTADPSPTVKRTTCPHCGLSFELSEEGPRM